MRAASPARECWRRRLLSVVAALCCSTFPPGVAWATTSCATPGSGWCVARRFAGTVPQGEIGFRFGEPLDVDGDGRADPAAGARFKLQQGTLQNGSATVWSGASGTPIREWDGDMPDGLFGHWVMPVPDVSGDGLADVVIAAPHAPVDGRMRGVVVARSPKTGEEIWRRPEAESENLGWDLTLAGDADGDGHPDLFVGAPAADGGRVYLLNGKDGTVLRTYLPQDEGGSFGWYVARLDDLDGDGRADLVVGAPYARRRDGTKVSGASVLSSASGKELQHWRSTDPRGGFGSVVAAAPDLDGDGKADVVVAAPGTEDQTRSIPGELYIYSSGSGKELRHWSGRQPGELFGRMVIAAGDLDGDGVTDLAIGAPWYRRDADDRVGRVEFRSARSGAVLGELAGDEADSWFGWHMRPAPDPDGHGRPALLVSSLRHPVGGKLGVGVLDLLVLRPAKDAGAQGTTTRGARRSDIK
ncbi:MAG TPA: FG-GAP-like repeat-containing protein [Candidatus Eisenbacteria bacterium]|nr:FG-GAP-like repeat-containing protein [Candidatus Eisenbacteria bacterium]